MKTLDFRHFKIFTDISQQRTVETDMATDFADALYKNANGIVAHDPALRIYREKGPVELTEQEEAFLIDFSKKHTTPLFQDSLISNII